MGDPEASLTGAEWEKVADRWSRVPYTEFSAAVYWLAIPEVDRRFQERACRGRKGVRWHEYCAREFLRDRLPVERMLSIGCGIGKLERALGALGAFQVCEAFDVAAGAIDGAIREAKRAGITGIEYRVQNLLSAELPEHAYDAIWCSGSLHHIEALEDTSRKLARALKPDGYFFLNEYVGPNRFDFSPRQKEAIIGAFALIPPQYRYCFFPDRLGRRQESPHIPRVEEVIAADPSEAIRSGDIIRVLAQDFEIVEANPAGGTLLQFLLSGIAGNFRNEDPGSMRILEMLQAVEDALIDSGDLKSDFVVLVARPRSQR